jgi:hypothetical protein
MAIIQGIISLLTRSVGKIFSALFDWAVVALFGRVGGQQKMWLSALMGAAAMWPVLLLGVAAPKIAVFAVAFVPLSTSVPAGVVRAIWVALAVLVPVIVGVVLRLQAPPEQQRAGWAMTVLRGFPITLGLSAAFIVLLLTVPVLRIASAVRGRQDVQMPLVTTGKSYRVAADLVGATLNHHGFAVARVDPPWWSAAPAKILHRMSGEALKAYVHEQTAYFRGGDLEVALYPNALMLRGGVEETARAHGLLVEALTGQPDMLQTTSAEAQDIERQIQRVWAIFRQNPEAHRNARPLMSRLNDISAEISQRALPFDEWQVVYRQALQLARALSDEPQLIERTLGEQQALALTAPEPDGIQHRQLPTRALVSRALEIGARLVSKEVELARAEVQADIAAELGSAKMLAGGAVGVLLGVNVMLLAALAVLALWWPNWAVAMALGVLLVGIGGLVAYAGWKRRVESPLMTTRSSLAEDVQWVKRRIA